MIAAKKMPKTKRRFARWQSAVAFVLFLGIMVNTICLGTMRNTIEMALGDTGHISEETAANSRKVVQEVSQEGIILLKNDDAALPLADTTNINVFGWLPPTPSTAARAPARWMCPRLWTCSLACRMRASTLTPS